MHRREALVGVIVGTAIVALIGLGTASTASANKILGPWYCPPQPTTPTSVTQVPFECLNPFGSGPSFDFGDRQVGTPSPAQGFALGVYAVPSAPTDSLTPEINVSGDYAQTNNCPPTLSAGPAQAQGCLIMVTFNPSSTGPKEGTLSTGSGGPTVALTGNGVTTPTPPVLPLLLTAEGNSKENLAKKLRLRVVANNDSTLVARGGKIKETTQQLAALDWNRFTVRLKDLKRLEEKPTRPKFKIKFTATDQFGQTATDESEVTLCRKLIYPRGQVECRW